MLVGRESVWFMHSTEIAIARVGGIEGAWTLICG